MNYEEAGWLLNEVKQLGLGFTPKNMRKFEVRQVDSTSVGIKFLEPSNTTIEDQVIVPILGVRIVMREDRFPENPFDGTLIVDNTTIGGYENDEYVVGNLVPGTEYYFGAYPYTYKEIYNLSNSPENRSAILFKDGETVKITTSVDEPALFPYAQINLLDVTTGEIKSMNVNANDSAEFKVPIYHEYQVYSNPVTDFSDPGRTETYTAIGDGTREFTFEYMYLKNIINVTVTADSNAGDFNTKEVSVTVHNETDGNNNTLNKTGGGNYRFPAENGKTYHVSYGLVSGYGTPEDSESFTMVNNVEKNVTAQYVYDVETVIVTVTAEDSTAVGQTITLHNVTDNTTESIPFEGTELIFFVKSGKSYYLEGDEKEGYIAPVTETYTAIVGNNRGIALNYETIKTLEGCTWSQIAALSESGKAKDYFEIHDKKKVMLTDGVEIELEIIGFDHDVLASDSSKKAGITFRCSITKNNPITYDYSMSFGSTNYSNTGLHNNLVNEFYNKFPNELKNAIKKIVLFGAKAVPVGELDWEVENYQDAVFIRDMSLYSTGIEIQNDLYRCYGIIDSKFPAFVTDEDRIVKYRETDGTLINCRYWTSNGGDVEYDNNDMPVRVDRAYYIMPSGKRNYTTHNLNASYEAYQSPIISV